MHSSDSCVVCNANSVCVDWETFGIRSWRAFLDAVIGTKSVELYGEGATITMRLE